MSLRTRWLLAGAIGSVLILLVGFLTVIHPAQRHLADINAATAEQYEENERVVAQLEQAQAQAAEVPARLEEIEQVKTKLPESMEQSDLVRSVETAAIASAVDLKRINAREPSRVEGSPGETVLVALPYRLTATGTYTALKTFVSELERLPRAFLIRDFYIGDPGDDTGELSMTVTGDFYSLGNYSVEVPENLPEAGQGGPDSGQAAAKKPRRRNR